MKQELDNRYFPLIFETIPHGIFTIDGEGRITSFNKAAEEITGYGREEAVGRPCHEIFKADVCDYECPLKTSVCTGQQTRDRQVTIRSRTGRPIPISISTAAIRDGGGHVVGGVEMFRDLSQIEELRKQLRGSFAFQDIISKNPAMRRIFDIIPQVAESASTVLIEGASGTGKELVARAIHNVGPRGAGPFVAVNCGALPDTLLESELFGYVRGAFTDAKRDKAGRFAVAEGGTIFLDEAAELSMLMQVKLLRVLQTKEYEPLGATQTRKADVRVIAATNKNLSSEVRAGRFREDLYYRLNVVKIILPPLAERREDIPLLVSCFIERFNALQARNVKGATDRAMLALMSHPFPGNIRELENAVEHAFVVCHEDVIRFRDLPAQIQERSAAGPSTENGDPAPRLLENAEAEAIRRTLEMFDGRREETARELGVSRSTLWRKMKRYGISPE